MRYYLFKFREFRAKTKSLQLVKIRLKENTMKLNNPPIREVIVGIKFKESVFEQDFIYKIYENHFKRLKLVKKDTYSIKIIEKEKRSSIKKHSLGLELIDDENQTHFFWKKIG